MPHDNRGLRERSIDLAKQVHEITKVAGTDDYGLIDELRRCSIILASQIAESESRVKRSERLSHLNLARRSLFELDIQARIGMKLAVLDTREHLIHNIAAIDTMIATRMQRLREQRSRDLPPVRPAVASAPARATSS